MNKGYRLAFGFCILTGSALLSSSNGAEALQFSDNLSSDEASCVSELLSVYYDYPGDHSDNVSVLSRSAKIGRVRLSDRPRKAYIFLFENIGWCGSAGCLLIIGEKREDNRCHLLYVGDGDRGAIVALTGRDHAYRRLYTPCEARFDGRQYRQVHEACPTADIQH